MLELILCSMLTILPDYLYRRFVQGKRLGKEITFFSVWFELRWGIVCLPDAHGFAHHPDFLFPPVNQHRDPVLQDGTDPPRRPSGVSPRSIVDYSAPVAKDAVIFRLDSSKQEAALETARRKIAEVDASLIAAKADVLEDGRPDTGSEERLQQAQDELEVKSELQRRNPGIVPQRDIEKLQVMSTGGRARSMRPTPQNSPPSCGSRPFCRPRRRVRKPRWRRRRSIMTRPSSGPA